MSLYYVIALPQENFVGFKVYLINFQCKFFLIFISTLDFGAYWWDKLGVFWGFLLLFLETCIYAFIIRIILFSLGRVQGGWFQNRLTIHLIRVKYLFDPYMKPILFIWVLHKNSLYMSLLTKMFFEWSLSLSNVTTLLSKFDVINKFLTWFLMGEKTLPIFFILFLIHTTSFLFGPYMKKTFKLFPLPIIQCEGK